MGINKGQRFGRLTVLAEEGVKDAHSYFLCRCDCGKTLKVRDNKLTGGKQISCGCARADVVVRAAARFRTPPKRRSEIARMGSDALKKD